MDFPRNTKAPWIKRSFTYREASIPLMLRKTLLRAPLSCWVFSAPFWGQRRALFDLTRISTKRPRRHARSAGRPADRRPQVFPNGEQEQSCLRGDASSPGRRRQTITTVNQMGGFGGVPASFVPSRRTTTVPSRSRWTPPIAIVGHDFDGKPAAATNMPWRSGGAPFSPTPCAARIV